MIPPDEKLRSNLYQAACQYASYIRSDKIDFAEAMRVANELEEAADAFADRATSVLSGTSC